MVYTRTDEDGVGLDEEGKNVSFSYYLREVVRGDLDPNYCIDVTTITLYSPLPFVGRLILRIP